MGNPASKVLRVACLLITTACASAPAPAPCPALAPANARDAPAPPSLASAVSADSPTAEGTWLFRCCDDASTWLGMVVLVRTGSELRGGFLTDADSPTSGSHASYLEGRIEGGQVRLTRRWRTGSVLHEQFYDLVLTSDGNRLAGTFTEPAFDRTPHGIKLERGFTPVPRTEFPAATAQGTTQVPIDAKHEERPKDPHRPCDCRLVCYCGGVPPGREHYEESARCGGSCKCPVCPPLP